MRDGEHRWVIDSIEEHAASVEVDGGDMVTLPRWLLPDGSKQGDVLTVLHDRPQKGLRSMLTITVNAAETKKAMAESAAQVKKGTSKNDPGGDITL